MYVLIAEDNADLRTVFSKAFEASGFEVETAHDGTAAFSVLCERIPEIVVVDVEMPGMSGLDLVQYIRIHDTNVSPCTIIVVTGNHTYADTPQARLADMFFVKPVRPTDLVVLARRLSHRISI